MGSQMSKTDGVALNVIGWKLDDDPQPVLYIGPTQKNVESISQDRLTNMLKSVPSLWSGLAKGQKDKVTEKFINGVRLGLGWAGSATELASHPAAIVIIDERDRMDDVKREGDPNTLADARTATYDGITVTFSTPTLGKVDSEVLDTGLEHWQVPEDRDEVQSASWSLWMEGSRHEWAWPCPDCREYYIPRQKLLKWPEGSTPEDAFRDARMVCPHCGVLSGEDAKEWMNEHGVFAAPGQRILPVDDDTDCAQVVGTDGETVSVPFGEYLSTGETDCESFWASGLCSPWRSFGHRARQFLRAVESGESGRIQPAINTGFGELFRVANNAPEWEFVTDLRDDYGFDEVPDDVQVLTCGVDVQKHSLIYAVRGWAPKYQSYLIRHGEIEGETRFDEVWDLLADVLDREYGGLRIKRAMVDTGYNPSKSPEGAVDPNSVHASVNKVYDFCRTHRRQCVAIKGATESLVKPLRPSDIDINFRGRVIKGGLRLYHLDTDFFKSWVYDRLEWPLDKPGGFFLSRDATDDYCQQLVAESREVDRGGKVRWIRFRKANHYLDCEMMNAACAHLLQLHRLSPKTREKLRPDPEKPKKTPPQPQRRRNWATDWRK